MSIERLLRDYNIPHVTEGHKHSTTGWVNTHCPFCAGSKNFHLGIHEDITGCHCWRCGRHSTTATLSKILNLPAGEVRKIIQTYKTGKVHKPISEPKVRIHPFKLPKPSYPLREQGRQYLEKRGFDAERIEKEWGISQTGPVSFLDKISYSQRIIIPIYWNGKIVSFQSRDMTDKNDRKYLACPMKREVIHHKNILYGKQEYWQKSSVIIVVEGVTDVWRLGFTATATFGTSFKLEQVLRLAKYDCRFFIVFDNERHAQEQARALAAGLRTKAKKDVCIETVDDDPGSMKQEDADYFVKQLIKTK